MFFSPKYSYVLIKADWKCFQSAATHHRKQLMVPFSSVDNIMLGPFLLHVCFQQTEAMMKFIQNSQVLNSPDLRTFAASLVLNALPCLTVAPGSSGRDGALVEMAVHTAAVLLCGHSPVLRPLRNLAFQPRSMQVTVPSAGSPACCQFFHLSAGSSLV